MSDGKINQNLELQKLNLGKTEFPEKEKIDIEKLIFNYEDEDNFNSDDFVFSPERPYLFDNDKISIDDIEKYFIKTKLEDFINQDENVAAEDDGGINSGTNERIKQERINNLNESEAAVYAQYEEIIENLEEGENVNDAIFEFMNGLSDEELTSFLQAYDYVNDEEGGMESLVSKLFSELINDEGKDIDVDSLVRLDKILSDSDKTAILDYYENNYKNLDLEKNLSALEYLLNGNSNKALDILFSDKQGSNSQGASNIRISDVLWAKIDPNISTDTNENIDDNGINSGTNERIKQERINNLDETEAAVYAQYEEIIENLEEGENVYEAIFEFMDGLSDEELTAFLQSYDYVNDEDGGMESLVSKLFNKLIFDEGKDIDVDTLARLDKLLSDSDKKAILDYYENNYNDMNSDLKKNLSALEYLLNGNSNKALDILFNGDGGNTSTNTLR